MKKDDRLIVFGIIVGVFISTAIAFLALEINSVQSTLDSLCKESGYDSAPTFSSQAVFDDNHTQWRICYKEEIVADKDGFVHKVRIEGRVRI